MNILVTGANGQLGNELRIISRERKENFIFSDIKPQEGVETLMLDVTNLEAVRKVVKEMQVDCVVNCAAYTNVNQAESDVAICEVLNAGVPQKLAVVMREVNGLLVQISTDYVFGGDPYNEPCREDQKGTPTGVYGLTKLQGERSIEASGCDHVILRTAWLYSEFGHNFVKTMLGLTANNPHLKVVFDQTGTPTYAYDLALAIGIILTDYGQEKAMKGVDFERYSKNGIYHYSNEGACSWYDFTKVIAEMAGHTDCDIQPCHSDEYPSPVKRPAYSVLDKTKFKQTFGVRIPYWMDSLKVCLSHM